MNAETSSTPIRPRLSALFFAAIAAMTMLAILGLQPLRAPEYWWHVALGEFITTWERIPDTQLFLFTVEADLPWVYSSWLGQVIISYLHDLGGAELLLLIRNVFAAISLAMIVYWLRRRYAALPATLIPAAIVAAGLFFGTYPSPQILYLPIATAAILLAFHLLERPTRFIAAASLPLFVAAGANIDFATSATLAVVFFLVGIVLFLRLGNDDQRTSRLITAGLATIAPLGLLAFAYGPTALPSALTQISFTVPVIIALALLIAPLIQLFMSRDEPVPISWKVSAPLFVLVSTVAILLQPGVPTRTTLLPLIADDVRTVAPGAGTLTSDLPLRCAEELRRTGRQLRVFHDRDHAGFLLYHLLDPRRPQAILFDDHRRLLPSSLADLPPLLKTEPIARGVFGRFEINAAVVDPAQYPALIEDLSLSPNWSDLMANTDEPIACFLRVRR